MNESSVLNTLQKKVEGTCFNGYDCVPEVKSYTKHKMVGVRIVQVPVTEIRCRNCDTEITR